MPDEITFDVNYDLQIICSQRDSDILDRNKATVEAVFRNNLTQLSSVLTKLSTDSTYFERKTHPLVNFSVDDFRVTKSLLSTISKSFPFETSLVTNSSKPRGPSSENTASDSVSKAFLDSTGSKSSSTEAFWMSKTDKHAVNLTSIMHGNGKFTSTRNLSSEKLETSKFVRITLTFGSITSTSAVSSTPLSDQLSTENNTPISTLSSTTSSDKANDLFDSLVYVAAVSTAAGVVGLGAAAVLIHLASRGCRIPPIIRFVIGHCILVCQSSYLYEHSKVPLK